MSFDDRVTMPVPTPVFWTALWAGMASPVYVYATVDPYVVYGSPAGIGESFAIVGLQLSEAIQATQNDQAHPQPANAA